MTPENPKYQFTRNETYYRGTVYEWNLPSGWTCPFALVCRVFVDRITGKMKRAGRGGFRCYAASAERFPSARESRWQNYEFALGGGMPYVPPEARAVRIHASGDFFSQAYFDTWITVARINTRVEFWAFTKSLRYWVARLGDIPSNLILTASYGGKDDALISEYGLKSARVYNYVSDTPLGMPIDTNDDYARIKGVNFALINNRTK